jgi:hypothetical protein
MGTLRDDVDEEARRTGFAANGYLLPVPVHTLETRALPPCAGRVPDRVPGRPHIVRLLADRLGV